MNLDEIERRVTLYAERTEKVFHIALVVFGFACGVLFCAVVT